MADVKQIEVNGVTYDIHDAVAREEIASLQQSVFSKVSMASGVNADIRKMTTGTQLFGIQAIGSNNHSVILIVHSNGISAYDYTSRTEL